MLGTPQALLLILVNSRPLGDSIIGDVAGSEVIVCNPVRTAIDTYGGAQDIAFALEML